MCPTLFEVSVKKWAINQQVTNATEKHSLLCKDSLGHPQSSILGELSRSVCGSFSCHLLEEGIRRLLPSWNWSKTYWRIMHFVLWDQSHHICPLQIFSVCSLSSHSVFLISFPGYFKDNKPWRVEFELPITIFLSYN